MTYQTRKGPMGGRYVIAKLGTMRKEREWLVQATSDDRIIVQGSKPGKPGYSTPYADAIGCFDVTGKNGRLTTKGGYFPNLPFAQPFEFPPEFVRACLEICQPLDAVGDYGVAVIHHTVQVIG